MPNFTFNSPSGQSYTVTGPDGATPEQAFAILQKQIGAQPQSSGPAIDKDGNAVLGGVAAAAPPQQQSPGLVEGTARAAATGVPIVGGLLNKLDAATNAALAPALNPLFSPENQLQGDTFSERYAKSLAIQNQNDAAFHQAHPIVDTGAQIAGGVAATIPAASTTLGARLLGLTGGNLATRAATSGGSGALLNAVDTAIRGGDPTQGAEIGGLTGVAGPVIGRVAGKVANAFRPAAAGTAMPTSDEVIDAAANAYHAPEIKAVEFHPDAITNLSDSMQSDLIGKRLNERLAPQTHGILQDLTQPVNGGAFTMEDLTTARQLLGDVAGNLGNRTDATAAVRAKQMIDNYLKNVPAADVASGDANAAGQILKDANGNYAAGKTAQALEGKIDAAELQAASANSGANLENALRQRIRAILTSPTQRRGFTPEEIGAMQSVVRGNAPQNILRMVGNLLGGGGGVGALAAGTTAAMAGAGPAAVAVPALGFAIKKAGNAIMQNRVGALNDLILARAPLSQPAVAARLAAAAARRASLDKFQNAGALLSHAVAPQFDPANQ